MAKRKCQFLIGTVPHEAVRSGEISSEESVSIPNRYGAAGQAEKILMCHGIKVSIPNRYGAALKGDLSYED